MDNWLKIVNFLGKNINRSFTIRELSLNSGVAYATTYRLIKRFSKYSTHLIKTVGRAETISLDPNSKTLINFLAISSQNEKLDYLLKKPLIKSINNKIFDKDIVLLFGSYAKNKETEKSDIDLLIINKKGEKTISFKKEELLFNKKINPIFVSSKEFKEMLKDEEENVGKQALKNHIILRGFNKFWELVLNGI